MALKWTLSWDKFSLDTQIQLPYALSVKNPDQGQRKDMREW